MKTTSLSTDDVVKILVYTAIVSIIAAVVGDFSSLGEMRFSLYGNVRKMVNTLIPAMLVVYGILLTGLMKYKRFLTFLLVLILSIALFLTGSRGAIFSLFTPIIVYYVITLFGLKKDGRRKIGYLIILLLFVSTAYLFLNSIGLDNILNRFSIQSWMNNPRYYIWKGAFQNLNNHEYIIGSGLGTYQRLETLSGHNYYAHSVFFDTLVTTGFFGFSFLIYALYKIFSYTIEYRNPIYIILLLMLIVLYSTHGSITGSLEFFAILGLIQGYNQSKNLKVLSN